MSRIALLKSWYFIEIIDLLAIFSSHFYTVTQYINIDILHIFLTLTKLEPISLSDIWEVFYFAIVTIHKQFE